MTTVKIKYTMYSVLFVVSVYQIAGWVLDYTHWPICKVKLGQTGQNVIVQFRFIVVIMMMIKLLRMVMIINNYVALDLVHKAFSHIVTGKV